MRRRLLEYESYGPFLHLRWIPASLFHGPILSSIGASGKAGAVHVFRYGIATHDLPNPTGRNTRTFVGRYDFERRRSEKGRWRISLFPFNMKSIEGNLDLERT